MDEREGGFWQVKKRGQRITRLMARDGDKCWLCNQQLDRKIPDPQDPLFVTLDHIIRRADGGLDTDSNVKLAHRRCNNLRADNVLPPKAFDTLFNKAVK